MFSDFFRQFLFLMIREQHSDLERSSVRIEKQSLSTQLGDLFEAYPCPVIPEAEFFPATGQSAGNDDLVFADVDAFLVVGVSLEVTKGQPQGCNLKSSKRNDRPRTKGGEGQCNAERDRGGGQDERSGKTRREGLIGSCNPSVTSRPAVNRQRHASPDVCPGAIASG